MTGRTPSPAAVVLMSLVLLWSGGLAVGFGYAAATGGDQMSSTKVLLFWIASAFLALLALRTGYELVRRLVLGTRAGG